MLQHGRIPDRKLFPSFSHFILSVAISESTNTSWKFSKLHLLLNTACDAGITAHPCLDKEGETPRRPRYFRENKSVPGRVHTLVPESPGGFRQLKLCVSQNSCFDISLFLWARDESNRQFFTITVLPGQPGKEGQANGTR